VPSRKAAVVAAVQSGKITFEEACRRYELSEEEFRSWQRAYQTHGLAGLRGRVIVDAAGCGGEPSTRFFPP
jgi:transposase-like protein